ncbi:MAG: bifunctional D-glycero-beta-D-manno-heptose-7-phosphate kinase/D-glycero-beta-D-manno-heptose 1-phosphate adenylyltransferase HldE [Gammaproteobacteria bacterium]|nr:bifunctional D-glycero-beta-D-manno-heptose-7-phosphate kinase/D-glycero-beta-D-manno-heptose 1-phosphate adenylyltransferase HldE [Gammaproteobacteria bacterium]
MQANVPDFSARRILVVGDVMLDRYWSGAAERISPEAPVPIVHVGDTEERPGGAANVAVNLAALGSQVTLLGLTGRDAESERLSALLAQLAIDNALIARDDAPTVAKLRVLARHQQLVRLDFERGFGPEAAGALSDRFAALLGGHDVVIASDYAKGALLEIQQLIAAARKADVPMLVDPKGIDFERYRGAWALTPNRGEFEAVVGVCKGEAELAERGERLRRELGLTALLVTRGPEGMTLLTNAHEPLHLPTHAQEVADVTGAGDTVIAVFGAGIACALPSAEAAALANMAAGIVVGQVGAASVSPVTLKLAAHAHGRGLVDEATLLGLIAHARTRAERIVMTNGCFDLLHAGHVRYLSEARALGDRLVVAVNDDASVRRLKGSARPVMPLEDRAAVLGALADVDWVVAFGEDTPARLIGAVLPDVLVKGGDYRPDEIAGGEAVRGAGGEVRILPLLEGRSTSALIDQILETH